MMGEIKCWADLNLNLTLPVRLVAICAVTPALHEVTRASTAGEFNICGDGSLLGDSEICAGLWSRRCSPQGVGFPLQGRIMN